MIIFHFWMDLVNFFSNYKVTEDTLVFLRAHYFHICLYGYLYVTTVRRIAKSPITDRSPTTNNRPATHRQVLHRPIDHWPLNNRQMLHRSTDKCSTDNQLPTKEQVFHRPTNNRLTNKSSNDSLITDLPTHRPYYNWLATLWLTNLIFTESPLDQFIQITNLCSSFKMGTTYYRIRKIICKMIDKKERR